jgi:outer membrane protein TolC
LTRAQAILILDRTIVLQPFDQCGQTESVVAEKRFPKTDRKYGSQIRIPKETTMRSSFTIERAVVSLLLLPGAILLGAPPNQPSVLEDGNPAIQLAKLQASRTLVVNLPGQNQASAADQVSTGQTAPDVLRLSLKEAVDLALKQNPQIQIANLRILESHGAYITGRSGYLPHLSLTLYDSYQTTNLQIIGFNNGLTLPQIPGRVGPFQVFDTRPVFQQTVLDLSLLRRLDVLREQIHQSQFDAMSVRESTLLSVIQLYLRVLAADSRAATSQARLHTAEALLNRAQDFLGAGTGNLLDEARARLEFQNESRLLVEARRDREAIRLLLMKTIGLDLNQKMELTDKLELRTNEPITGSESVAAAVENRPEMKSLQARLKSVALDKQRIKAERYPTVGFTTDYGVLGSSIVQNVSTYTVKGSFNLPILQGGRIKGEMEAADARYKQVEQEVQQLKMEIQLDIQTALVQLDAARQAAEAAQKATAAARTSLDLARQKFEAGVTDNIDVISAQESIAIAEDNEIHTMFDFMQARANMARAKGDVVGFLK